MPLRFPPRRRALILLLLAASVSACSRLREAPAATTPPDTIFDQVVELFREERMTEAVTLLQQRIAEEPRDAGSRALLGHLYHHLQMYPEGIRSAREALRIRECSSYAHVVLSTLYNPHQSGAAHTHADSAWTHALAAMECDEADGNAWMNLYAQALERGDEALANRALVRLHELGFFAPDMVAHNRWVLESLPTDAILVTNGDLDTYPALALQAALGVRRDVIVVNATYLNTPWYAERLARMHRLPFETPPAVVTGMKIEQREDGSVILPADRIIDGWRRMRLDGTLRRDIAFAPSLPDHAFEHGPGALRNAGTHRLLDPAAPADWMDEAAVASALQTATASNYVGPGTAKQDLSLVRNAYSIRGGVFPFLAGLELAEEQIARGRRDDARRTLAWLRAFADEARLGSEHLTEMAALARQLDTAIR
ncbi:MAG TPA: hypothetical protein VHG93_10365 [Longimicrobium sp.]|nr:hypothetical protein [Longimicrobium sp.]